jgi:hypothetical protein
MDLCHAATGDPYPMEMNPDEIPMFARFVERGLALPASNFYKGLLMYYSIEYLNLSANRIFHVSIFVHFCEAFVGIKPHWILFLKFFRVKPLSVIHPGYSCKEGGRVEDGLCRAYTPGTHARKEEK